MASRTPPKQLRKEILGVFKRQPNKPLNHKQVASTMGIMNHDMRRMVMTILEEMGKSGQLEPLGKGKFTLAQMQEERVTGTIQVTKFGRGFVMMPDGKEVSISKGFTGTAFWGDTVEVDWIRRGKRHTPRVSRVVERLAKTICGGIGASPGIRVWLSFGSTPPCQLLHSGGQSQRR